MSILGYPHETRASPQRIILGIDPGVAITGYALVREHKGKLSLLACGVLRTPAHTPLPDRLYQLYEQPQALLATISQLRLQWNCSFSARTARRS